MPTRGPVKIGDGAGVGVNLARKDRARLSHIWASSKVAFYVRALRQAVRFIQRKGERSNEA